MKQKILLDIDGVLANFHRAFARYLNHKLGINIDENVEPSAYGIDTWAEGIDPTEIGSLIREWLASGGYKTVPIYPDAKQFAYQLMDQYDVYVVTARIGDFKMNLPAQTKAIIKKNTIDWFKENGIPADKIFFEHRKIDFCKSNGIKVMVEDKLSTVREAADQGIMTILMDRAYNRDSDGRNHPNIIVAYGYDEVMDHLSKIA